MDTILVKFLDGRTERIPANFGGLCRVLDKELVTIHKTNNVLLIKDKAERKIYFDFQWLGLTYDQAREQILDILRRCYNYETTGGGVFLFDGNDEEFAEVLIDDETTMELLVINYNL